MNTFQELQKWYQSQCNGDWEHTYGLKIDTVDNPGWSVTVDLADTYLSDHPFIKIERRASDVDWIFCEVREFQFLGYGGPFMLEEILKIFLAWAAETQTA